MKHTQGDIAAQYEGCLATSVRLLDRVIAATFDEALRPHDIKSTQLSLLVFIDHFGQPTAADLVPAMRIDQTTLSRNLDRLEAMGLIERVESDDARARPVRLSRKGRKLMRDALPAWESALSDVRDLLGTGTADRLVSAANRLSGS